MATKQRVIYRNAIDGRIVTKEFALRNPKTTVKERVEIPRKRKGK